MIFVVWAVCSSELETDVISRGELITQGRNFSIAPMESGILKIIDIREGEFVKKGTLLCQLDPIFYSYQLLTLSSKREKLENQILRLEAELYGSTTIDLLDEFEKKIYQRRIYERQMIRAKYQAYFRSYQERISIAKEKLKNIVKRKSLLQEAIIIETKFLNKEANLYAKNFERQRELIQTKLSLENLITEENEIGFSLKQLREEKNIQEVTLREWEAGIDREIIERIDELRNQLVEIYHTITATKKKSEWMEIRAPHDAFILKISEKAVGSTLTAGENFILLSPEAGTFEFRIDILPTDISRVEIGQPVTIKLDSMNFSRYGTLVGRIKSVSADTIENNINGQKMKVYQGIVSIEENHLFNLPESFRLRPGMEAQLDINTGTRTLLSYLITPIQNALDESFIEP